MRGFGRQTDRLAQRGVRVDGFADVYGVGAHFDRQRDFADQIAGVAPDDAAAQDAAVASGFGAVVEQQLGEALLAAVGQGAPGSAPREQALAHRDALRLGLLFGQAHPSQLGVGVGHAGDHAGIESRARQIGAAQQFARHHLGRHVRLVHRLVRQHRLADHVADGEDVGHVAAHLRIDFDEAAPVHGHAGALGGDLFAVGCAAHGLQHQVVQAFAWAAVCALELHPYALGCGLRAHGFGFEQDAVEAPLVHLLPDLDQIAVGARHQAVEHLDHIQPRAQRRIDRAHLEADDAAADDQHLFGHAWQRQRAGAVNHPRIVWHEGQAHGLRAHGDDAALERQPFFAAGLRLAAAVGFLHFDLVRTDEGTVAAHDLDLAHFGHGTQATGELADDLVFVRAQLVHAHRGGGKFDPERAQMAGFFEHRRHVQQGLGGDAAHV